jgi:hypothetical protein
VAETEHEYRPVDRTNALERALAYAQVPPSFTPRPLRTREEAQAAVASFEARYPHLLAWTTMEKGAERDQAKRDAFRSLYGDPSPVDYSTLSNAELLERHHG